MKPHDVRREKIVIASLAILAFLSSAAVSRFVLEDTPHVADEVVYLFQARMLSSGRLYLGGGLPSITDYYFVYDDGLKRWGKYPPGWPLVLSLGVLAGMPWIVNPIIHAVNLLLIYLVGKQLYGSRTGAAAAVLVLISPFMLFMGANMMSHTLSLFLTLSIAYWGLRARESGKNMHAFFSGLSWGMLVATRFYTGVLFGSAVWLSVMALKKGLSQTEKRSLTAIVLSLAAAALPVTLMLYYNAALTGNPLLLPYTEYIIHEYPDQPTCDDIGFGEDRGCPFGGSWIIDGQKVKGHNIQTALLNLLLNVKLLSSQLFGWPFTSFWLIILLLYLRKNSRQDLCLIAYSMLLVLGYSLFWNTGLGYGPRYYYDASGFLVLLSARGLLAAYGDLKNRKLLKAALRCLGKKQKTSAAKAAAFIVVTTMLMMLAWSIASAFMPLAVEYGNDYQSNSSKVDLQAYGNLKNLGVTDAAVIVPDLYWGSGFLNNDLDLKNNVLFFREGGFNGSLSLNNTPYGSRVCLAYRQKPGGYDLLPCEKAVALTSDYPQSTCPLS